MWCYWVWYLCCFEAHEYHSKKQSTLYKERCAVKRANYLTKFETKSKERLIFIDESDIDSYLTREYGRARRGKLVHGEKSGMRFARESFIVGLSNNKLLAPFCYTGTMDKTLFNFWLLNFLIPETEQGIVMVMDNAVFHKSEDKKTIIENAGCELLFLPP